MSLLVTRYKAGIKPRLFDPYHIVLVVENKKRLLERYGDTVKNIFFALTERHDFDVLKVCVAHDHIHLMVERNIEMSHSHIIEILKNESAVELLKSHPELENNFSNGVIWSDGCFLSSVGGAYVA